MSVKIQYNADAEVITVEIIEQYFHVPQKWEKGHLRGSRNNFNILHSSNTLVKQNVFSGNLTKLFRKKTQGLPLTYDSGVISSYSMILFSMA